MWLDDAEMLHTVALPDPTALMTAGFRDGLDAIRAKHHAVLRAALEAAEEHLYDVDWSNLPRDGVYIAAAPPNDLLHGSVITPHDVAQAIAEVDLRWRLDAVMAITDYVD